MGATHVLGGCDALPQVLTGPPEQLTPWRLLGALLPGDHCQPTRSPASLWCSALLAWPGRVQLACTSLPALVTEPSCWDCGTVPKLTILAGALLQRLLVRNDQRPQRAVALAHQHTKPAGVGWHGRAPA